MLTVPSDQAQQIYDNQPLKRVVLPSSSVSGSLQEVTPSPQDGAGDSHDDACQEGI